MTWINGRPDDWHDTPVHCGYCDILPKDCHICRIGFESGASAMLSALIKWLFEPCDKHEETVCRIDCPDCMKELRGEK